MDERYVIHRLRATRWAAIVGIAMMGAWTAYEYLVFDSLRVDLIVMMVAMALTKLIAMVYYRRTD